MVAEAKQDQTAQSEEVNEAGNNEVADTAVAEETEGKGLLGVAEKSEISIEDIMAEKADASSDNDELTEDQAVSEAEGVSPKSQERINRKISNAIKEKKIALEEARRLKEEVEQLKLAQSAPKERPLVPLREDFETGHEYQEAMVKYEDDLMAFNNSRQSVIEREKSVKARSENNVKRYLEASERMREKFDDFDELVNTGENKFGHLDSIILESEYSPEVAYYLAKNTEQLDKLKSLDRNSALLAIGELSGRFKTVQKNKTNAPRPLNTLSQSGETAVKDIYAIKDNSAFLRARNEEILKRRARK